MRPIGSIDENRSLKYLTASLSNEDRAELELELKEVVFREMLDNEEVTTQELKAVKIDFDKKLEELSEDLTGRRKNSALRSLL